MELPSGAVAILDSVETAEYEEKQYEGALVLELAAGQPTAYASGQVLENIVGYDVALRPGEEKIWDLLNAGFPQGALLSSGLWATVPVQPKDAELPRDLISLVLQIKRPHLLDHWRAGQHHYWRGPYFRFHIYQNQHAQLAALERGLGRQAAVRYAAAAFLEMGSLYKYQRMRTIAEHSTFVSPGVLTGHRLWSYQRPGTRGYANPEGEPAEADTWNTLSELVREAATRQTLVEHVRTLADLTGRALGPADWLDVILPAGMDISQRRRDALSAWSVVVDVVAQGGAEWFVLDVTA